MPPCHPPPAGRTQPREGTGFAPPGHTSTGSSGTSAALGLPPASSPVSLAERMFIH